MKQEYARVSVEMPENEEKITLRQELTYEIENIRSDMKAAGCVMDSWFRLHVTLGRVKEANVQLSAVQELTDSVSLPAFSLTLEDVDYRIFRGKTLYETKLKSQN